MSKLKSSKNANSKELLRHAFDVMHLLKSKAIDVEEAKGHANLLKQANNILKYELDRAVANEKYENISIRQIEDLEE